MEEKLQKILCGHPYYCLYSNGYGQHQACAGCLDLGRDLH